MKLRILDPLGMSSTTFRPQDGAEQQRMAKAFSDDVFLQTEEKERLANPVGNRGVLPLRIITDYARFAQMLLERGKNLMTGDSEAAFRQMTDHVGPGSGVARDYFLAIQGMDLALATASLSAPIRDMRSLRRQVRLES